MLPVMSFLINAFFDLSMVSDIFLHPPINFLPAFSTPSPALLCLAPLTAPAKHIIITKDETINDNGIIYDMDLFQGRGQLNFPWTEPMATSTSTTWVKIYPSEYIYFCNAKVAGLDKLTVTGTGLIHPSPQTL